METALGIICALLSGAGVMYFFLETTGGLRQKEYERKLEKKVKDLEWLEEAYLKDAMKRRQDEENEASKWSPNHTNVSQQDLSRSITAALAALGISSPLKHDPS